MRSLREVGDQFDSLAAVFDRLPIQANAKVRLFPWPAPGAHRVAVDIGCGTGGMLFELGRRCEYAYGLDISREMLVRARDRVGKQANVSLIRASADAIPFRDGSVDYVVAHTTLHHLNEVRPACTEIARILRPGGVAHIVDIVSRGVTGKWPVVSVYVMAIVQALSVVAGHGVSCGLECLRISTHPKWIEHQRAEVFLDHRLVEEICAQILPGAVFRIVWAECRLTAYVHIAWQKAR